MCPNCNLYPAEQDCDGCDQKICIYCYFCHNDDHDSDSEDCPFNQVTLPIHNAD